MRKHAMQECICVAYADVLSARYDILLGAWQGHSLHLLDTIRNAEASDEAFFGNCLYAILIVCDPSQG